MAGLGATAVLFFGIRAFAAGPPRTMTKEYQEASDEYLKVRLVPAEVRTKPLTVSMTGIQGRAYHRYFGRRLQGRLHGPEQACRQAVNAFLMRRLTLWEINSDILAAVVTLSPGRREGYTSFWSPLSRSTKKIPCTFFDSSVLVQRSFHLFLLSLRSFSLDKVQTTSYRRPHSGAR